MPKLGRFGPKKRDIQVFFCDIQVFFLGDFKRGNVFFSFFFWLSRFFFWISLHISRFFFDQILEDYHDKNSQKRWKWPKFQWRVKFLVTFVTSESSVIPVKWAILKKVKFCVFSDIKRRCYLVISENSNFKRIENITNKSRTDTNLSKNLNFETSSSMTFSGWVNSSRFNKVSNFWIHNELCLISWENCFGIWSVEEICIGSIFLGHKRRYHTHSDVIFGWVAWICLSISDFFAEYLDFVFTMGGKIENSHGGPPPGPRGSAPASVPRFAWSSNFASDREKTSRYSANKTEILSQIHATQPKITSLYVW